MGNPRPRLDGVGETSLIPLYARARDAGARRPVLGDQRAREIVDGLDYDFTRFRGSSLSGSVFRSSIFDCWVRRFLREHPAGTVVELGAGLNTRFDRVDNGQAHWVEVDLPDVVALRRGFLPECPRRRMVAGSVLESAWLAAVSAAPAPYLFVSEAVLLYLDVDQAHRVLRRLAGRFPGAQVAMDTAGARMVRRQGRNRSLARLNARLQWVCDDPHQLRAMGLVLLDSRTLATPQPEIARRWPASRRYAMRALAWIAPAIVDTYRFNLFRFTVPAME